MLLAKMIGTEYPVSTLGQDEEPLLLGCSNELGS